MAKATDKKLKILEAAVKIFARDGFEKASVDQICFDAGVAKGTVYYHFAGKEDLFAAIITEGKKRFDETVRKNISGIDNPVKQLEIIIETEKKFIMAYRNFFVIFITQIVTRQARFELIEQVIEDGVRSGYFKKNITANEAAASLFWSVAIATLNNRCHHQAELLLTGLRVK